MGEGMERRELMVISGEWESKGAEEWQKEEKCSQKV